MEVKLTLLRCYIESSESIVFIAGVNFMFNYLYNKGALVEE